MDDDAKALESAYQHGAAIADACLSKIYCDHEPGSALYDAWMLGYRETSEWKTRLMLRAGWRLK